MYIMPDFDILVALTDVKGHTPILEHFLSAFILFVMKVQRQYAAFIQKVMVM